VVYPLRDKSVNSVGSVLEKFIDSHPVRYLRGDGEPAFLSLQPWLEKKLNSLTNEKRSPSTKYERKERVYFTTSKFTYHNKLIDSAIRTIRNAIGYRRINEAQLQKIVEYYNHTHHKSIDCTPLEMMQNPEYEEQYIRYCMQRLLIVKQRQEFEGLLSYEKGNILLLHCDLSKTAQSFEKRRRFWDRIGEFIRYDHGNAIVLLLGNGITGIGKMISLPVQFTRLIAKNKAEIPSYYHDSYTFK
jgi:hypothetical protein